MAKTTSKPRKEVKSNPGVIEIYPYKGGYRLRFIGSNGKVLNHTYNTPLSARRGIQAMEKLMRSFVVLKRQ